MQCLDDERLINGGCIGGGSRHLGNWGPEANGWFCDWDARGNGFVRITCCK